MEIYPGMRLRLNVNGAIVEVLRIDGGTTVVLTDGVKLFTYGLEALQHCDCSEVKRAGQAGQTAR